MIDKRSPGALIRGLMRKAFWLPLWVTLSASMVFGGTEPPPVSAGEGICERRLCQGQSRIPERRRCLYFFDRGDNDGPAIDLAVDSIRPGIMLSNPHGSGFFAGNWEFLGEVFGGGIFHGPGSVEVGGTLIFRYNFIQPNARVIPHMQIGAGGIYTDIGEGESRGLVSLPVEFNLQGTGGLRFMLDNKWSLILEAGYRHISNGTIELPNRGVDSVGGDVGLGFFF